MNSKFQATDLDGPNDLNDINLYVYADAEDYATHELKLDPVKPVSHRYCFMTGRHGEFMYLKLGAACKLNYNFSLVFSSIHQTLSLQLLKLICGIQLGLY